MGHLSLPRYALLPEFANKVLNRPKTPAKGLNIVSNEFDGRLEEFRCDYSAQSVALC